MPETRALVRRRGTNLPRMGDFNLSVILDAIRRSPEGLSRVELAGIVGLAAQTVSNICRRLLNQNLIVEAGKYGTGPGKPRTILKVNPAGMFAVGVHLDPTETSYALLDLTGNVVAHLRHDTDSSLCPDDAIEHIAREVKSLIIEHKIDPAKVAGVGVAAPGPIDVESGVIVQPPHLPNWGRVELRQKLAKASSFPVILDKDVGAAAVAEIWSGGQSGAGSYAFIYLGTGIGSGLVIDDEVVGGCSGNAGEIGHIIVDRDSVNPSDGLAGRVKGTLMPADIVREAIDAGVRRVADADPKDLHAQVAAFAAAYRDADGPAQAVMNKVIDRMAVVVSVQSSLLDLDHVVFGGPFWEYFEEAFLEGLPKRVSDLSVTEAVHGFSVMGTAVNHDVGAVGAACLVLEDTFGPHASSLMLSATN